MDFPAAAPQPSEDNKVKTKQLLKKVFSFKVLATVIMIILSYQVYSMYKVIAPVKDKSEGLIDELNSFRNNTMTFASDLNEIREYLLLPTKDYSTGTLTEPNDDDLKAAILTFIGSVGSEADKIDKVQELQDKMRTLVDGAEFQNLMREEGLSFHMFYPEYDGQNFYNFLALKVDELGPLAYVQGNLVDGSFLVDAFGGKEQLGNDLNENLMNVIKEKKSSWLEARKVILDQQVYLAALFKAADVQSALQEKKMSFVDKYEDTIDTYLYKVDGPYGPILRFGVLKEEPKLFLDAPNRQTFAEQEDFKKALLIALQSADLRSPIEKLVMQKKEVLDSMFGEEAFKFFLEEFGGSITSQAKEEPDRYVYSLYRQEQALGSIILEKGTGKVKVLRNGEEFAVDVFDFSSEGKKKT